MNAESSIGLGWDIIIPVTPTVTPFPTETPTLTPSPTATEIPSETPEIIENQIDQQQEKSANTILHTPEANAKTYIFSGAILLILIGAAAIAISIFLKKK